MTSGIAERFARIPALFAAREALVRKAERARIVLLLEAGEERRRLRIESGSLRLEEASGPMESWDVALRAAPEAWFDHWAASPLPHAHDILGMARYGRMRIEGNFLPLMRHLQLVKDVVALPRRCVVSARFDPITGRYLRLDLNGRHHRLYIEEAGQGIPLLCLHTAGADARQYRDLLLDEDVTSRFRVIAFDMPWHGKSSPPEGWPGRGVPAQHRSLCLPYPDRLRGSRP